jgi:hypothetical protein
MRAYPLAARRASGSRYERIRFPRSNHSYHLNLRDSGGYRPSQTAAHIRRLLARLPPDSEPRSAMSDFRPATTPAVRSRSGACRSWLGAGPAHPREPSACAPIGSPCSSQSWAAASTLTGPGCAQPGINFLALLPQRLDDVLLGPAADLVPPALAVRSGAIMAGSQLDSPGPRTAMSGDAVWTAATVREMFPKVRLMKTMLNFRF